MVKYSLEDLDVGGKRVLIRVDFNVPQDKTGTITDDTRIEAALPTIRYVLKRDGIPVLMSHLGRPKGKVVPEMTLAPVALRLKELLGSPVLMAPDSVGPQVESLVKGLQPGEVLLLENLRFHPGEEKPDQEPQFADQLAKLGDLYINDAFGTAHRAHSSMVAVAHHFPNAAAGYLLQKEINFLGEALLKPAHPFVAIIGGAKVSSKLGVIKALIGKVDQLLIGGGMAFTFLKGEGKEIGNSLLEEDLISTTAEIREMCEKEGTELALPIDQVVAPALDEGVTTKTVTAIPHDQMALDIGPKTLEVWEEKLAKAKTALWNGPVGAFEVPPFDRGTTELARVLAGSDATTIVGGGDSIAAVKKAGVADKISHISTGGGAALEYIEFGTLPGISALGNK